MTYTCTAKKLSDELSSLFNKPVVIHPNEIEQAYGLTAGSHAATNIVKPHLNNLLNTHRLKTSCHIEEGPCKRLVRMFAKKVGNNLDNVSEVPDVGRLRLLVTGPDDIEKIRYIFLGNNPKYTEDRIGHLLDNHPTNNIEAKEFEDFYYVPSSTGRVALHLTLNVKIEGNTFIPYEVQMMLNDMIKTEEFTRDNYINKQAIERIAENKNRPLTKKEKETIESYERSSKERYNADSQKYDLIYLRRGDLERQYYNNQKSQRTALKIVA